MKHKRLWLVSPLVLGLVVIATHRYLCASRANVFERKVKLLSRANRIEMHEPMWTRVFPLNARQVHEVVLCARDFDASRLPQPQNGYFQLDFYNHKQFLGTLDCAPICPDGCSGTNHGSTATTVFVDGYELHSASARRLIALLSSQNGDA